MNDFLILAAIFVSVLILAFTVLSLLERRRAIRSNLDRAARGEAPSRIDAAFASENDEIAYYFDIQRNFAPTSLPMRLIAAGNFSRSGPRMFNLTRAVAAFATFVGTWFAVVRLSDNASSTVALFMAAVLSGLVFILVNFFLDRRIKAAETRYRRLFPDFMDLLIVCVDSGLSIEAAIDRVAREFIVPKPDFGKHLAIISLEVRAGRPLHEALQNFADRVRLDEARSLATLFRQSQELGSSVVKTLRVFSAEMRQLRLVRAEELANALPVKMLFPMATFLFPVNLVIVLVPIMITILEMLVTLKPGG